MDLLLRLFFDEPQVRWRLGAPEILETPSRKVLIGETTVTIIIRSPENVVFATASANTALGRNEFERTSWPAPSAYKPKIEGPNCGALVLSQPSGAN
jgi:hypothetical protein